MTGTGRLLIVSPDVIGTRMAGPAIRYWEIARAVSASRGVTLAVPSVDGGDAPAWPGVDVVTYGGSDAGLSPLLPGHSFLLLQPFTMFRFPSLRRADACKIFDLYDPFIIELLEHNRTQGMVERMMVNEHVRNILMDELAEGDYFVCASERQRSFWLGVLLAAGKVTPAGYDADPSYAKVVGIAPFGLQGTPPASSAPVIKGVVPGIDAKDKVVIWGGGLWNWFDPGSVVKAMTRLKEERPQIKLFFMGGRHPNPAMPRSLQKTLKETLELAKRLGVLDKNVFFNPGWVPYEERGRYLLEADAGISTHFDNIETRYSFRTRILDYLWAGLPIITTEGDHMAELVRRHGLGRVVGYGDVDGIRDAILGLLEDAGANRSARENVARVRPEYTWENACRHLLRFMDDPGKGPVPIRVLPQEMKRAGLADYGRLLGSYWSGEGPVKTIKRALAFIGRRL